MKTILQLPGILFYGTFDIIIAIISLVIIGVVIFFSALKTPVDFNALFEGRETKVIDMWTGSEGAEDSNDLERESKRQHYPREGYL